MCFYDFMVALILIFLIIVWTRYINFRFIPYYFIAGFITFILGKEGFAVLDWSSYSLNQSISYFIAAFFAIAPQLSSSINKKYVLSIIDFWGYSILHIIIQWTIGCIIILIFNHLHHGFVAVLPSGFVGGHSTALALSEFYQNSNWPNNSSIFTTSATLGFMVAIAGGFFITKKSSINLNTLSKFSYLNILKNRDLYIIVTVVLLSILIKDIIDINQIPIFVISFILSHLSKNFIYLNKERLHHINELIISFIITISIALLDVEVLSFYKFELTILFSLGILAQWLLYKFVAPLIIKDDLFEKRLLTWGWTTGVVAITIALNQSYIHPEKRDEFFEKFAFCYLLVSPIELMFLIFIPIYISHLKPSVITIILMAIFLLTIILLSIFKRYEIRRKTPPHN